MIQIHRSNRLENLASQLADDLKDHSPEDPLTPTQVIVPNRDTARWLKLFLAEQKEILANTEFILPAEWQFRIIRKEYPNLPGQLPADPGPLAWRIFDLLMDDAVRKNFSRPDRYVSSQPPEMKDRAVMQLSQKIASVFDEYIVYRPEMMLRWQKGEDVRNPDELWQSKLWRELEKKRKVNQKGIGYPNKAELILEANNLVREGKTNVEHALLLFNTGLIPKPLIDLIRQASTQTQTILYQVAVTKKDGSASGYTNNLLKAFGEESAGVNLLLDPLNGEQFYSFPNREKSENALQIIQSTILSDQPFAANSVDHLNGIEIHSCHSSLREIEVLHQFLLRSFEADNTLHPDDVLVVMPDIETYKPLIHAVFGTQQDGVPSIPYHVDYRRLSSDSVTRAFLQLLDLADSRYQITDVMDFMHEPVIHQSFDLNDSSIRRLKQWIDDNNVVWGLDGKHRKAESQPETDIQTWWSAVQRGWEGIFYGSTSNPFDGSSALQFGDIRGQDMEEMWSAFSAIITRFENLYSSVGTRRTIPQWCDLMDSEISFFFTGSTTEADTLSHLQTALDNCREECSTADFNREVPFSLFRSHLKSILDSQSASPAHFTRGVTFSSMVPVRSIPARIVALIGLNETDFPRKPRTLDFDLMANDPKPFERNPKNQDRSLFLESILAARHYHYISYIGQSKRDNETIPPSPIVSEWLISLSIISGKTVEDILVKEPLHGFSERAFETESSFSKTDYLAFKSMQKSSGQSSGLFSNTETSDSEGDKSLSLSQIEYFISNPLRSYIKEHFNPYLSGLEDARDEFELDSLQKHQLFERIFGWRLQGHSHKSIDNFLKQSGALPPGWQGEVMFKDLVQSVDGALQSVRQQDLTPEVCTIEAAVEISGYIINGEILSYSEKVLLDITPSSERGDKLLQSWIRHLFSQMTSAFDKTGSWYVCNLKKGEPKWFRFRPADNPGHELERFLRLYLTGLKVPLTVFPNASVEYQKEVSKEKKDPMSKARIAFEGTDFSPYSENMDPFTTLVLGEGAPFRGEYLNRELLEGIEVMQDHLDEIKPS